MSRRTERSGPAQMTGSEHAGRRQRERHTEAAACSGRAPGAAPSTPPPPRSARRSAARRNSSSCVEMRCVAMSATRPSALQLGSPSRAAVRWAGLHPPPHPPCFPPLYYYPYQTGAAPTTRPASSRRVTSFRRGARARGGAGRARSRVTILTVSRRMLVERRERTSWGMRERARMNCLSVCLSV